MHVGAGGNMLGFHRAGDFRSGESACRETRATFGSQTVFSCPSHTFNSGSGLKHLDDWFDVTLSDPSSIERATTSFFCHVW